MASKNQSFMLGEIAYIRNGTTPDTSRPDYWDGDVRWVSPKDLADGNPKYVSTGSRNITQKGARTIAPAPLPANSILLSSRAPIGLLAIAKNELYTNQGFKNIIIKDPEHYSVEYIYYYLGLIKDGLINIGSGTTFKEISKSVLEKLRLDLPEYKIQDSVANLLKMIDDKISINSKINSELEHAAQLIYDYWFTQFDFPDAQGKPYKSSGGTMVYNDQLKRAIPVGWRVAPLGNYIEVLDSKRVPLSKSQRAERKGSYPYYGATGIIDYIDDYIYNGEYILVAEDGSIENDRGYIIVQYVDGKVWVNNHAHVLSSNDGKYNEYLYRYLLNIPAIQITTGSIQKKITRDNLNNLKFTRPSDDVLAKFAALTQPIRNKIIDIKKENSELAKLRDWLLPMLMTGQVKVGE